MRNEIELLIAKHGSFWLLALLSAAISKLYTKDREIQTTKTVLRSILASLVFSYVIVEWLGPSQSTIIYVFIGGLCIDPIVRMFMKIGPELIQRLFNGPKP